MLGDECSECSGHREEQPGQCMLNAESAASKEVGCAIGLRGLPPPQILPHVSQRLGQTSREQLRRSWNNMKSKGMG